jgi:predicted transcriptional regulator
VDKFKRTIALYHEGYNVTKISFLLRISTALIEEYIDLYKQLNFIAHRRQELAYFLKKSPPPDNQEVM